MKLRPYQTASRDGLNESFSKGSDAVILCLPTGGGKTVTFANLAKSMVDKGRSVMVVVDRKELLKQSQKTLIKYGLNPELITAGKYPKKSHAYVATVQTLIRRTFPDVDLIIIDEAHKQCFDRVVEKYKESAYIIGATATPTREGKKAHLGNYYDDIVNEVTIEELISLGFLSPAITFGVKKNMDGVKTNSKGDYDTEQSFELFNKPELYQGVVDNYLSKAPGTKAICFNVNVQHSQLTTAAFRAKGIRAAHIDAKTPTNEREKVLEDFAAGRIDVLCNVAILTTGFDEPSIETVIVNRATKSESLWLQMCGRGSRIFENKDFFTILDQGGNTLRLGFWEQNRTYSLEIKPKKESDDDLGVPPVKICPEDEGGCGLMVAPSVMVCPECGYSFPAPKKKEGEHADLVQLENSSGLPSHLASIPFNKMTLEQLEEVRVIKKYKLGWIIRQIQDRPDFTLEQYAKLRGYKPGWVYRQQNIKR